MHLHIAGFLLALLLVAVILFGLWEVLGLWLVYGPLALGGLVALAHFAPRLAKTGQDYRRRRLDARRMAALDLKRRTAAAEAALGIPVPTEGYCPACGSPLVAAARYCGHCRYAVASGGSGRPGLPLVLCPRCAERQPDGHATYCFACGAILAVPAPHATTSQPRQAAGGPETEQTWPRHGQMS